jgi:SNF2 family DNA or RNA helicase
MSIIEEKLVFFNEVLIRKGYDINPYQMDGVKWLLKNELNEESICDIKGGFVADEMGLGKTIMMIGLLLCNPKHNTLIILPTILIEQWYIQIYKLTGHKSFIYHGNSKKDITMKQLKKHIIVLATYDEISKPSLLHEINWNRVIFDEAHHLRNNNTQRFQGAKKLIKTYTWCVTGTPIQNRKRDFYSLCSIIGLPASYYTEDMNFKELASNFILKRTKQEVGIKMPDIITENVDVLWKNKQEMELCMKTHKRLNGKYSLTQILRQKQSCVLPRLLMKQYPDDMEATQLSSKMDKVIEDILEKKGNMNGKLVFAHFKEEMRVIESRLSEAGMDVAIIDGSITGSNRTQLLEGNKECLILQINTCCEGLNLQANYNEIYFVSPHWNPYIELQAIARCHRIGQTKTVIVKHYKMQGFQIMGEQEEEEEKAEEEDNIEKYIFEKQEHKINIANELFTQIE